MITLSSSVSRMSRGRSLLVDRPLSSDDGRAAGIYESYKLAIGRSVAEEDGTEEMKSMTDFVTITAR